MADLLDRRGTAGAETPTGAVRIRACGPGDLEAIHRVESASYSTPWSLGTFRSLFEREGVAFHVAELAVAEHAVAERAHPPEIVGYAVLWRVMDEAELANLAVAPALRGRGIGSALLDRTLEAAKGAGIASVFLEVRGSNERALALYRARGFRQVGVRRQYYDRPREDALILRLELRARRGLPWIAEERGASR